MLNLKQNEKLQVLLAGAVTTTECPLTAAYEDFSGLGNIAANQADSVTTGATAVDLVAAPAAGVKRKITHFSIFNADTVAVTVTVRLNNNGTTRIVAQYTLQTGEGLYFDRGSGWRAIDVNGNTKTNQPASSGASSTALSAGTQASTEASKANASVATASSAASVDLANASTADSKAVSAATVASTASSTLSLNLSAGTSTTLSKTKSSFGF